MSVQVSSLLDRLFLIFSKSQIPAEFIKVLVKMLWGDRVISTKLVTKTNQCLNSITAGFACNSWARGVPAGEVASCMPKLRLSLAVETPAIAVNPATAINLQIPRLSSEKDL